MNKASFRGLLLSIVFTAKNPDQPLHIVYVPSHLYHMLFELFKVEYQTSLKTRRMLFLTACLFTSLPHPPFSLLERHESNSRDARDEPRVAPHQSASLTGNGGPHHQGRGFETDHDFSTKICQCSRGNNTGRKRQGYAIKQVLLSFSLQAPVLHSCQRRKNTPCVSNTLLLYLKMSDRGGGVPLRKIERLFSYMYSTAPSPVHMDNSRNAPLVRLQLSPSVCSMLQYYKHAFAS